MTSSEVDAHAELTIKVIKEEQKEVLQLQVIEEKHFVKNGGTQTDFRNDYLRLFPHDIPYMNMVLMMGTEMANKVEDQPSSSAGSTSSSNALKRKAPPEESDSVIAREIKKAKLETKALKAKRPGFTDERYNETSYYVENGLRKVYPYYFTFTTFTKGRWVGEKILDVFAREFRAHPVEEYERCIKSGTLTVNYAKVSTDYRLKHNDLLANIVHRHEVPVTSDRIDIVHMDEDLVVVNKPASIPVHPCGRYRHNTVVFILAKEHNLKNLRTIHRLDRLTSGLLLFGRNPKKARDMEHQIRTREVQKEYVCRVEGVFPDEEIVCQEPIEVVSYKIGVCKVSPNGKDCQTIFKKISTNGKTSVVSAKPKTGRMHQIRVHLQYLGYPIVNDPLYNHSVFGPEKGKKGVIGKTDEQLIQELISIHNAENWLGIEGDEGAGGGGMFAAGPAITPTPPLASDETLEDAPGKSVIVGKEPETLKINGDHHETIQDIKKEDDGDTTTPTPAIAQEKVETKVVTVATQTDELDCDDTTNSASATSPVPEESVSIAGSDTPSSNCDNNNVNLSLEETSPLAFKKDFITYDHHCYECKVRYRDPKPRDLIMFLHAIRYGGPGWSYETPLPLWAGADWVDSEDN